VLDAAAKVFFERGYAAARVQDVGDELGLLKGSIYYYIDTKEDLLFRLVEGVHEDVENIIEQVAASDLDALGKIELYVRLQISYTLDKLERITVYYHDLEQLSPDRLEIVLAKRRAHDRFIAQLIREAQTTGVADPSLDPSLLTQCLFATVIGVYRWWRPRGRFGKQATAEGCAQYVLRGIIGRPQ
jgi:TetR/AcrR family transcriptional regulator, cholesterol catabolism regulator